MPEIISPGACDRLIDIMQTHAENIRFIQGTLGFAEQILQLPTNAQGSPEIAKLIEGVPDFAERIVQLREIAPELPDDSHDPRIMNLKRVRQLIDSNAKVELDAIEYLVDRRGRFIRSEIRACIRAATPLYGARILVMASMHEPLPRARGEYVVSDDENFEYDDATYTGEVFWATSIKGELLKHPRAIEGALISVTPDSINLQDISIKGQGGPKSGGGNRNYKYGRVGRVFEIAPGGKLIPQVDVAFAGKH